MTYTVPPGRYSDVNSAFVQAYIDAAIADVIDLAPETLNSLNELAAAIGDDANFITTVNNTIAAVQADVNANETAAANLVSALETARGLVTDAISARVTTLEADPTTAAAVAAVQADVDQNELDSDAAESALSGRLDTLEADPTTQTLLDAVQADVDQNESDSDAADTALSNRLDTLEADPTTATALAAVQADVDQNETDSDAADAALSTRIGVLEADPTTATAVAAVQADVDQNESDADAAIALKLDTADPAATGTLTVDTNARLQFDSNLTKVENVLRGTGINIGNNIEIRPAAPGGRVEVTGGFHIDITEVPEYSNDSQAEAGGIQVGGIYRSGSVLHIRAV